ncbi:FAD-dependent monooxygenase [Allonocardiopsis opalescens]|uniref:2-polyprenyl-6-methoxyphenol hydroxylase-like FAD-dependent oxidoreductase n=1 Tax=Allonocardiopsis opalescens TaxID=1144618 RepID=A0A2T0PYE1_9ACTN|nr:FAD-dependent monooxygenase [Allonocardiopsis opalescens]PRX96534.1 2-polyprenyl-6-methoxyphenol hydroxylase-like FAD-dependent oxidoreductase [Allonocardiopsis opalescens]
MPNSGSRASRRALVVGAGIAGLAVALRLRTGGWEVLVVERAPARRGGGYLVNFSDLGYDAAERMGLAAAVHAAEPEPVELRYVDRDGRVEATMGVRAQTDLLGERQVSIFRGDLESVLFEALDEPPDVRFGTTVTAIEQDAGGVTATLSDGTRERADLLVGADGLHSRVRSLVFGPEEGFRHDFGTAIAIVPLPEVPSGIDPGTSIALPLVRRGVSVITPPGRQAAAFFIFRTGDAEAELAAGAAATLRHRYGDLGWVVPELLDAAERNEADVYFDQVSQVRADRWSVGRVVPAGDAAWCVSLFAGFGSSLAVGGAEALGDELDRQPGDVPAALEAWERRLRPVAERWGRQGRRLRGVFVAATPLGVRARVLGLRIATHPVGIGLARRFLAVPPTPDQR